MDPTVCVAADGTANSVGDTHTEGTTGLQQETDTGQGLTIRKTAIGFSLASERLYIEKTIVGGQDHSTMELDTA
jgi:hypothetical protein